MFKGVAHMIESSSFQVIKDWAKEEQTRELILRQGLVKFGDEPTDEQKAELMNLEPLAKLDRLALKLMTVDSWAALFRGRL